MRNPQQVSKHREERIRRRRQQRRVDRANEEKNRQKSVGGGQPNELGVIQGQSGEQGNTVEPRNARPLGKLAH